MISIKKAEAAAKFLINSRVLRLQFATYWIEDHEIVKYDDMIGRLFLEHSMIKSFKGEVRIYFSRDMDQENPTTPSEQITIRPSFIENPDLASKIFHKAGLIIDCGFSGVAFDINWRDIASDKLLIGTAIDNGFHFLYTDEIIYFSKGYQKVDCGDPCFQL